MLEFLCRQLALVRWEWRIHWRDRTPWVAAVVMMLLSAAAIANGWLRQSDWHRTIEELVASERSDDLFLRSAFGAETDVELIAGHPLSLPEAGRARTLRLIAKLPTSLAYFGGTSHALQPPTRLASLSTANFGRFPDRYLITAHSRRSTLERSDLTNPFSLSTGPFDLAALITLIFPLIIIGLNYDVISAEREQGRMGLTVAQGLKPSSFFLIRGVVRIICPLTLLIISLITVSLLSPSLLPAPDLAAQLIVACAAVAGYALLWVALCLMVNALSGSSTGNAVGLSCIWVVLVLVVPTAVASLANHRFPSLPESQLVLRERELRAELIPQGKELLSQWFDNHPELKRPDRAADRYGQSRWDIISHHVDQRMDADIEFDLQQAERRDRLVGQLQVLSPALTFRRLLDDLAGVSEAQFTEFRRRTTEFHARFKGWFLPGMLTRAELSLSDLESRPQFQVRSPQPESVSQTAVRALTILLGWVVIPLGLAVFGMRRLSTAT